MSHTDPSCHPPCGSHIKKSGMVYSNTLYVASMPAKFKKNLWTQSQGITWSNFFEIFLHVIWHPKYFKKSVWQNFSKIFYLAGIILFIKFEWPFSKYILAIDVTETLSQPFLEWPPKWPLSNTKMAVIQNDRCPKWPLFCTKMTVMRS